jgi:phosphoesterase RecJ-like protein
MEIYRETLKDISEYSGKTEKVLITTHVNPDGDCIASVLVLARILNKLNRPYVLLCEDSVPEKFQFLPGVDQIQSLSSDSTPGSFSVVIVVDSASLERVGRVREYIAPDSIMINIDHHTSNTKFGKLNLVDAEESSTVEIVYQLYRVMEFPVTPEIATLVYTGIVCDTGRFLFPNTTYRSLQIASDMVRKGARTGEIAEYLYYRTSLSTIRALAASLSTLEIHFDGKVAGMYLANGCIADESSVDTEGFVDYLMSIKGTEVEFFMCEKKPGLYRISFRSKNDVDVNQVAGQLGGGGHKRASGCTVEGSFSEVRKRVLKALQLNL